MGAAARHPRRGAGDRGDLTVSVATARVEVGLVRDRPGWGTMLAFLGVASVLGLASRTTLLPEAEFATVWPSAGVTVLWLLVRQAAPLSIDTALMFASMLGFALLMDIPEWMAVAIACAHTLQTLVVVALLRRFVPDLWGCGGDRPLDSPRMLAAYLASIAAGVLVSAAAVTVVWTAAGDPDTWLDVLLWTARNYLRDPPRHHGWADAVPALRAAAPAEPAVGRQQAGVHRRLPQQRCGVRRGVHPRRGHPAVPGPRRAGLVWGQVRHPDELPARARARLPGRVGDDRGFWPVRRERPRGRRAARPAVRDRDRLHWPGPVDGPRRARAADLRASADVPGDDLPGPADERRGQLDGRGARGRRRRRALAAAQPGGDARGWLRRRPARPAGDRARWRPARPRAGRRDRARRGAARRRPARCGRILAVSAAPLPARHRDRAGPGAADLPRRHRRACPPHRPHGVRGGRRPRPAQPVGRRRELDRDDVDRAR